MLLILITGCNSIYVPPVENYQPMNKPKVALLVDVHNHLTHTHIGTTIFNNFSNTYDHDWTLKKDIYNTIAKTLETNSGAEVLPLSSLVHAESLDLDFVNVENKMWQFNANNIEIKNALVDQGIIAVITVKEVPKLVELNCSQYGCSEFHANGHGLYTRSFFGMDSYYTAATYNINAEIISQPIDLSIMEGLLNLTSLDNRLISLDVQQDPADHKKLEKAFFTPVKTSLMRYFDKVSETIADYLNGHFDTSKK